MIWENIILKSLKFNDKNYGIDRTERYLNTLELAEFYGYCVKNYTVKTEDGYLLNVARIGKRENASYGSTIFLMHGFINCADDFLTLGGGHALSFLLADAGYDVWLGNARGNKYSKNHVILSTKDPLFWNFSFHDIGYYDLPAMIDFVLDSTNKTQLTYIGHSQGTTAFFVMASLRQEYNQKVKMMISLATLAWAGNIQSPVVQAIVPVREEQYILSKMLGLNEFFPSNEFTRFIFRDLCCSTKLFLTLCETLLFTLYGFDYGQMNATQAPVEMAHFPAGASIKNLLHLLQLIESKEFRQFDHGTAGNLKAYGSKAPSSYPVQNITTPIAILYGLNDWLSTYEDVKIFISKVPSVCDVYRVPYERWNHMDYLWGRDAKHLVYEKVLALVKGIDGCLHRY